MEDYVGHSIYRLHPQRHDWLHIGYSQEDHQPIWLTSEPRLLIGELETVLYNANHRPVLNSDLVCSCPDVGKENEDGEADMDDMEMDCEC